MPDVRSAESIRAAFRYAPPTDETRPRFEAVTRAALQFALLLERAAPPSPELTLAIRKTQDARMWANCAIATNPETRNPFPYLRQPLLEPAEIARIAHEVNRAYCLALGDLSQLPWDEAPEWQRESAFAGVMLHLSNPDAGPEASHEAWAAHQLAKGWQYGPAKDVEAKTHPCLVPFAELPVEQQAKDFLFRSIVHALSV